MNDVLSAVSQVNWQSVHHDLHQQGFVVVPNFLSERQCQQLINTFNDSGCFRKTVVMEKYRFGLGVYKYWQYPLPQLVQTLREHLYPYLLPVANEWMRMLGKEGRFADTHLQLLQACRLREQLKPTPLILKYTRGGFNTLHQDLYGDVYFPLQVACFLSQPERDYTGGEFVLSQQIPRAQSSVRVLRPHQGDMVIFTTNFRPLKGDHGYYRGVMKHGVSEVTAGERYTLGVIFHDALS